MKGKVQTMEDRIYNEKNGMWYERRGDYYIPCIKLTEEGQQPIGVWGQRHKRYLKEHRKGFYAELLTSGKLNGYLADIDRQARDLFSRIVDELAKKEGITERLKAENQMEWVGRMNSIRNRSREVVNHDIVFCGINITNDYQEALEPPNAFWKYYDLYRRAKISLAEFSKESGLSIVMIKKCLLCIK